MRIGMMADMYKPHISGVTNHIAICKQYFEKAGHEVYVFTFRDEDYQDEETNVIRSPRIPLSLPYGDQDVSFGLRYSKTARKLLQSMDIVHVHHPLLSGLLALRYCRPKGIPIIFTNHTRYDLYVQAYLPYLPDGVGKAFLETYLQSFCRACDLVIAPSNGMREVLLNFGINAPIQVVPNGVNLALFRQDIKPCQRSKYGFTPQDLLLLYVGRLGPEKNLPFLLRCFAGAVDAYNHLGLILVGDGPEKDNLEDRVHHMGITDRVSFTGQVPYESLPSFLTMADIFTTASVTEVHPLSVIEAMAVGLPVLGIHSPGVGDTVIDGVTGFLSSRDLAAYTAKLIRLITDRNLRECMSEAGRQSAENFSIERTSQVMMDHYQRLIQDKQKTQKGWLKGLSRRLPQILR